MSSNPPEMADDRSEVASAPDVMDGEFNAIMGGSTRI